jgi:hypothetical protein
MSVVTPPVAELLRDLLTDAGDALLSDRRDGPGNGTLILSLGQKSRVVRELFGPVLGSYVVGAPSVDDFNSWVDGDAFPPLPVARRICLVYTAAEELRTSPAPALSNRAIRTWFIGTNQALSGAPPVEVVRNQEYRRAAALLASALHATMS